MTTDSKTYKDSGEGGISYIRPNAWREREMNFSCGQAILKEMSVGGTLPVVI